MMTTPTAEFAPSSRVGSYEPLHESLHQLSMWEDAFDGSISPGAGGCMIIESEPKLDDKIEYLSDKSADHVEDNHASRSISEKIQRRLAQNREAARKSRLRKKAYVQQLETSRMKLAQLETELERARQQAKKHLFSLHFFVFFLQARIAAFEIAYVQWIEEEDRKILNLRNALQSPMSDAELRMTVNNVLDHYRNLFHMKKDAARADAFYLVSGICFPPEMAVKSADASCSCALQKEKEVLANLGASPYVIYCFGDETTRGDNGSIAYNLLLEYASGGTLADRIAKSGGGGLPEVEVKMHARSILRGLCHVHDAGYVHCDLKPDNILLVPRDAGGSGIDGARFTAKIGGFGLAKRGEEHSRKKRKLGGPDSDCWRGSTPMYLSPDSVQEAPSDVWAVGCIVLEMLTGKQPWEGKKEEILEKLGTGQEIPEIPEGISREAKDFIKRCLVRKPTFRFTCGMLLNHTFVDGFEDEVEELEDPLEDSFCLSPAEENDSEEVASHYSDHSDDAVAEDIHVRRGYEMQHCPFGLTIPTGV
ncbi:mitogen-activated protein kinase kinase kinase 20 [Striga hermonthica]|uniref:Mitogen-activated protein kinase kinase kinase 20 n=1 Tax=Striga hermonthica TaxID=68872 RepID=A0A9N7RGQ5_STRHE|nr:mitogen-activated protein kinase kinase kinase 20 [Striga hermonthica]